MGTHAKPNADEMIARQIDDEYSLDFRVHGTDAGGVNEVDAKSKAFKGDVLKEVTVPQLGVR